MDWNFLLILITGAVAGGFINGLAGFGTALISLGIWLQIMPPLQAVSIVAVMSVISGLQGVWLVRRDIAARPARLARFLIPGIIGLPLGVAALNAIDADGLKAVLAGFMLLYGGFFCCRRQLPKLQRPLPLLDATIGFLGGILGGAASLSGALPTMFCALRGWSKGETRAVLQPYNVVILGLAVLSYAWQGNYDYDTLILMLYALPATMIGAQIGLWLFRQLSDGQFQRLLIWFMFGAGLMLTIKQMA